MSRKALTSDSDDDPFAANIYEEEDDDPFAEDRVGSGSEDSGISVDEDDLSQPITDGKQEKIEVLEDGNDESAFGDSNEEESADDMDEDMKDEESLDDPEDEASSENEHRSDNDASVPGSRGDLRAFLSNDSKSMTLGLSQAASADAAKGRAVKRQYQTFDRILDARMKLQKGLIASDELVAQHEIPDFTLEAREALQMAQESARQVFDNITSFRESIRDASSSEPESRKRKRTVHAEVEDDLNSTWEEMHRLDLDAMSVRRATLNKWSSREKAFDTTLASTKARQKFQSTSIQPDELTAILDVYVTNEQDKHFRSHEEDEQTSSYHAPKFDDSLFYQSLLRDLITSRSATSSATNNLSGALLPSKLHPSGNKENKKSIDTKASKGRKIRYTVHEKLQNFMAAEGDTGRDTAMWTERGKNEFFGSLFGQDRALVEDMDASDDGDKAEVEALRLFKT